MPKSRIAYILAASLTLAAFTHPASAKPVDTGDGRALFEDVFNPETYFPFDWRGTRKDGTIGVDEMILTVRTSARDDYIPDYAFAVAYVCAPVGDGQSECDHVARMLRFKDAGDRKIEVSSRLIASVAKARTDAQKVDAYNSAKLEWLETSLWSCEGAIEAFDALATKADWQPLYHYTRVKMENREVILHPAAMWITMQGHYRKISYEGWRNNDGASAGANALVTVLDKCWKPAKVPPPWRD